MFWIFILQSIQFECVKFNYSDQPQNTDEIKSGIAIQLTNTGLQNYFAQNAFFSKEYIIQTNFDDVILSLSGFKFKLSDIHIKDITFPLIQTQLVGPEALLSFLNASLQIEAQFSIVQESYPYMQDSGSAAITIRGLNVAGLLGISLSDQCLFHYVLMPSNFTTSLESLSIKLNGTFAVIYNSILQSLSSLLTNKFNDILGQNIVYSLFDVGNSFLAKDVDYVCNPKYTTKLGTDQRVNFIQITQDFLTLHTLGQTMMSDSDPNQNETAEIYGYVNYNFSSVPQFITNDHVQYKYHYLTFQSNFEKMIQTGLITQKQNILQVDKIESQGLTNTGLLANIYLISNNKSNNLKADENYILNVQMKLQPDPLFYVNSQVNQTLIYVNEINIIEAKNLQNNQTVIDLNIFDDTLQDIVRATQKYGVQITNSNYVRNCTLVTIDNEWIHVGCNIPIVD